MKKITKNKKTASGSNSEYLNNKWVTTYFDLYCDVCGAKHPDICVNELCREEGFPDGDFCWNCQRKMRKLGMVGEDKSKYFLKERSE